MEQRATIQERIGEYVLKISKPPRTPTQQGGAARANPDKFYPAWEEACRAQYGGEHRRAHYEARDRLKQEEKFLVEDRKEAERDPENLSKLLQLAERLQHLGRCNEAEDHFQAIMGRPDELTAGGNSELWSRIGRYHYRGQRYWEAASWFERTPETLGQWEGPCGSPEEYLLRHITAEPTLDRLLVSLALGKQDAAEAAASLYISKLGRLPWPYRLFLAQANIDSEAMYIEMHGGAA